MATQNRNTLNGWAIRGWKPLAQQVRDWFDSFWHKDDPIPVASIEGLTDILNSLPSADAINQLTALLMGHPVNFAAPGFYTLENGRLLEFVIIKSATNQVIKVGNSDGVDDLSPEQPLLAGEPLTITLHQYAQGNRNIYFSGFTDPVTITFYKR